METKPLLRDLLISMGHVNLIAFGKICIKNMILYNCFHVVREVII